MHVLYLQFISSLIYGALSFCRCGPLSCMWCMRYEAKHSYFKHLAHVLGNFKNIPKTLAEHHQMYMCYHMADGTDLRSTPTYPPGNCLLGLFWQRKVYTRQIFYPQDIVSYLPAMSTSQCNNALSIFLSVLHVSFYRKSSGSPTTTRRKSWGLHLN